MRKLKIRLDVPISARVRLFVIISGDLNKEPRALVTNRAMP